MKTSITLFLMLAVGIIQGQNYNHEITTDDGKKFLLGKIDLEGIQSEPYAIWYNQGHKNYLVDETLVKPFRKKLKKHQIKVFLGTWCGDSKREVPRFIKILEAVDFPMENLEIVALDRRKGLVKTSPSGEEKGLNIVRVPTFIFFKDGKEVNRIIERPIDSLEEDITAILTSKTYVPNYATMKKTK